MMNADAAREARDADLEWLPLGSDVEGSDGEWWGDVAGVIIEHEALG